MRLQGLVARIGLVFGSVLFVLILFEIGFRIAAILENRGLLIGALDTNVQIPADGRVELGHMIRLSPNRRVVYELKPNLSVVFQEVATTTDGEGFRTCGGTTEADPGSPTIVGLGDSFMFGYGVADGESYLCVLSELLRQSMPEGGWRVINTGVPGYNTVMEIETLKERGLGHQPRLVIIEFVGNDLSLPNFVRTKRDVTDTSRSFLADFVTRTLKIERGGTLWRRLKRAGLEGLEVDESVAMGSAVDPSQIPPEYRGLVGWDAYAGAMEELQELSRRHDFRVLVVSLAPEDSDREVKALAIAQGMGFAVLDVGSALQRYLDELEVDEHLGSPLALSATDGHPSALGHEIAGKAIYEYLGQEGLLPAGADL